MSRTLASELLCTVAGLTLFAGCCHQPVYPDYGSALVTSSPPRAEIELDGVRIHRATPCRIDGLSVGTHAIKLRSYNYKNELRSFRVKPAQTTHVVVHMVWVNVGLVFTLTGAGRDLAYDPAHQRLYLSTWGTQCWACDLRDSMITHVGTAELNSGQRLIAVAATAGRLFCLLDNDSLALVDLATLTEVKRFALPGMAGYRTLDVSPDGSTVMAADSINGQLVLLDASDGTVVKRLGLPAAPSAAAFSPSGSDAYATLPETRQLVRVSIATGGVLFSAPTGNNPGNLFWDLNHTTVGCCNKYDKSITLCDAANGYAVTTMFSVGGTSIDGACYSSSPEYLFVIINRYLEHCYIPEWTLVGPDIASADVGKIIRSAANRRYYYAINGSDAFVVAADF